VKETRHDGELLKQVLEENDLLRSEVKAARRASQITAQLVVEQFVKIEKMLQRLQESEQRYRDLYEQSVERKELYKSLLRSTPDAVAIMDVEGRVTYVNSAFRRIFGFSLEELEGRDFFGTAPDEDKEEARRLFRRILEGERVARWETRRLTKDGALLDVTLSASPYMDHEGKPAGAMVTLRNVTDRKRAEQLLQRERETFYTILEKAPYGVCLMNPDGRIAYLNSRFTGIFGYTLEDVPDREEWLRRAYPDPDYRREVKRSWEEGGLSGDGGERVFSVACKDGRNRQVEFRRTLLEDGRTVVMAADATRRKKAEEQIRRAKDQWERTFDAIDDIITIQDSRRRVLLANRAASKLLGEGKEALIGKHCYELFRRRAEPCEDCPGLDPSSERPVRSKEVHVSWLDRTLLVSMSPLFDDDENVSGVVHTAKDITEKRKMEEDLIRTQKLKSVGILAGGIAHDFNNLLTAFLGNISLARMYADRKDKVLKKLEEAEKACLAARRLTRQLLTFARGGEPVMQVLSLGDLVRDSVDFAVRGSNVGCELDLAADLWPVEGDGGQMDQVVNNLVVNAVQAMPRGGVVRMKGQNVRLPPAGENNVPGGEWVRISVIDEGAGIAREHLPQIFDPYFSTRDRGDQKGMGLGLTIAHSIVARHGGYLRVESPGTGGTAFHVYLPPYRRSEPEERRMREERVPEKLRVLLLDDEEMVRDIGGEMLQYLGCEVALAGDGAEAVELFREAREKNRPFHGVVMDLTIPGGMGGVEAVEKVLEIDPDAKVVVSSGYSNDPVMARYGEYGFAGRVAKPYRMDDLNRVLREVFRN